MRCPLWQLTVDAEYEPCLASRMLRSLVALVHLVVGLASLARFGLVEVMMKTLQEAAEDGGESVREGEGMLGVGVGVGLGLGLCLGLAVRADKDKEEDDENEELAAKHTACIEQEVLPYASHEPPMVALYPIYAIRMCMYRVRYPHGTHAGDVRHHRLGR